MRHTLWNSVAIVSSACVIWALFLAPSPVNDFYRYGYGVSGVLCLIAFVANRAKWSVFAASLLVVGSVAYLVFPARTFVRLLLSGEWALLFQTIAATFHVPQTQGYSGVQAATWFVDLLVFNLAFAIYFLLLPCIVLFATVSQRRHREAANGA